ncbi:MAG: cytochrome C oxidase subunit IV family protein [Chloroflexi bacterium]|nr:cytochrome C oxidase subunit IV family protein [Chloroflexota bacterium]
MTVEHKKRPYLWVFLWLGVLTAIEVSITYSGLPKLIQIILLVGLAATKVALVALFYMHLRYDKRILALIGGFPFFLATVMALIILADRTLVGGLIGG